MFLSSATTWGTLDALTMFFGIPVLQSVEFEDEFFLRGVECNAVEIKMSLIMNSP